MTDRQKHSVRTDAPEDDSLSESVDCESDCSHCQCGSFCNMMFYILSIYLSPLTAMLKLLKFLNNFILNK